MLIGQILAPGAKLASQLHQRGRGLGQPDQAEGAKGGDEAHRRGSGCLPEELPAAELRAAPA